MLTRARFVVSGLAVAAVGAACASAPTNVPAAAVPKFSGGPRLAFDNSLVDFGPVPYLREVKATFTARNVGNQPLLFKKVDVKALEGC